ncbi:hypothetical protein EDB81DRAFT_655997 [Dactylonectria macrodidyma]|uniref:Prion-inhibition and propagation HeLo domain-containing protein n=1 Tax=Dactylonectria macrodidyma TaxID=307937 RepID=A0A9P9IZ96_9HYPO|nr:hypothetical protein EDB81DRAFT_655997 [Dactylonectria macrodidyma]
MEAVGLTVGVVGLAGLFSSCLEAVDKFKAAKVRLEEWGRLVGFEETMRSEDHHPALDSRDIFATVNDILQIINTLCDASDTSVHRTSRAMTPGDDVSLGSFRPRPHGTRRRKLVWTLWGKTERTDQVELFEKLVQQLHNLVPVDAVQGTSSGHAWPAELQRILARIEEANRGKLSSRVMVDSLLTDFGLRQERGSSFLNSRGMSVDARYWGERCLFNCE